MDDGTIMLRFVAMVPESQLWTLEVPHRSKIARALAWASETEPAESLVDALVRSRGKRRSRRPSGRRK